MKFRTEINPDPSPFRISHETPIMLIGSCFSDNIGMKLSQLLFPARINPFGVVYNPLSVIKSIDNILNKRSYTEKDLFFFDDLWHSWDHHSIFSSVKAKEVLQNINSEIELSYDFLKKGRFLIITFGTSWVYRLKDTSQLVCNCHKVPASEFRRELISVAEIVNEFNSLLQRLRDFNPELDIIFTISPVRHWKDGANGNQLSKSILQLAIHDLRQNHNKHCEYFPAYEILLDDLRDYRFFTDDLLHPNAQAIDYIYEKFNDAFFNEETKKLSSEIDKLVKASKHRIVNPGTEKSLKFNKTQINKIRNLKKDYPFLQLDKLETTFSNAL